MIQVFVTGGTFDKQYNYLTGELWFNETHLPKMLSRGRCTLDVDVQQLMMMDSLDMSEADIDTILNACKSSDYEMIVITHGTDRMVETAHNLAEAQLDKVIVITGAMIPYAFGTSSDGFFNLGSAMSFVQVLPKGVYIAMNGQYFLWNKVVKNRATGYFEALA
jgi:L-asparaginase